MNTVNRSKCARGHQPELDRQHHEEGQDQAAVVAAPGRRQRDELAQRKEGDQREQHRGHACRPAAQAIQNTTTMNQEVRSSLRKFFSSRVPGLVVRRCARSRKRQQERRRR